MSHQKPQVHGRHYQVIRGDQALTYVRKFERQSAQDPVNYVGIGPLDLRRDLVFRLKVDGQDVGFAALEASSLSGGRVLTKIYVSPDKRRCGIASFFINSAEVVRANVPAKALGLYHTLHRLGFRIKNDQRHPGAVWEMIR